MQRRAVPIIEPEVLQDGSHTIERSQTCDRGPGIVFLSGGQSDEDATRT